MNTDIHGFGYFLEYVLLFLDDNVDNTLRVLLSICLIFCQFQPGVAYKGVAYKKKRVALK